MSAPEVGWWTGEGGVRLRWTRWDAAAPRGALLVVHGFGDHAGRYADLGRVLGARGYTVLAYDQRGHGGSEGKRGDAPSFAAFLADLDRAWAEAERVLPRPLALYAHSFGALVAMRWLQTRPVRPGAVVLTAPWLATALAVPRWKLIAARILLRAAPGLAIPSGSDRPDYLTRDPERAAAYRDDPLVHHRITARFHAGVLAAQAGAGADPWPTDTPTLVVVPGDDPLVDAGAALAWARARPSLDVRVRAEGRHELHNDLDREASLGLVADWLDRRLRVEPEGTGRVLAPGA